MVEVVQGRLSAELIEEGDGGEIRWDLNRPILIGLLCLIRVHNRLLDIAKRAFLTVGEKARELAPLCLCHLVTALISGHLEYLL